jgi:hypothetical protein
MITYPAELLPEADDPVVVIVETDAETFRRGRAAGMRDAAEHCADPCYAPGADRWELANCFDNEADGIEAGE